MFRISTFVFLRRHLWHLKGRQRTGLQQLFKAGVDDLLPMMMIMMMMMMLISCLVKIVMVKMLMIVISCLKGAVFAISFVSITRGRAVAASAWLKVK